MILSFFEYLYLCLCAQGFIFWNIISHLYDNIKLFQDVKIATIVSYFALKFYVFVSSL
jgi:hypothetical protein